jgi:hypothetical protein
VLFVQVTVSPPLIVTLAGVNARGVILTVRVAFAVAALVAGIASTSAANARWGIRFIKIPPQGKYTRFHRFWGFKAAINGIRTSRTEHFGRKRHNRDGCLETGAARDA